MILENFALSDLDTPKTEVIEELKIVECFDIADVVYRKELTRNEIIDRFNKKQIGASTIGYTLPHGTYESSDLSLLLGSLHPIEVNKKITIDRIRLRMNLTTNKTKKFIKKPFF